MCVWVKWGDPSITVDEAIILSSTHMGRVMEAPPLP